MSFRLTFVAVSTAAVRYLEEVEEELRTDPSCGTVFSAKVLMRCFYVGRDRDQSEKYDQIRSAVAESDLLYLDLMGASAGIISLLEEAVADYDGHLMVQGSGTEYLRSRLRLGTVNADSMKRMRDRAAESGDQSSRGMDLGAMRERLGRMPVLPPPMKDVSNWITLQQLWTFAGRENTRNLVLLLCRAYGKVRKLPAPGPIIDFSRYPILDPTTEEGFDSFADYRARCGWDSARPTVGVLFTGNNYPYNTFGVLSPIVKKLRCSFNVIPFCSSSRADAFARLQAVVDEGARPDVVWNFVAFRLGGGPMGGGEEEGVAFLRALDVPVMHPFFLSKRNIEEWRIELASLSPTETIILIMLPELDGVVDTIPVAGLRERESRIVSDLGELHPIDDRVEHLIEKSHRYTALRRKANADKKVAIILYNYPPGEGTVGGGAFLDTFRSVAAICSRLSEEGYDLGPDAGTATGAETFRATGHSGAAEPVQPEQLRAFFMERGMCNGARFTASSDYPVRYPVARYSASDPTATGQSMLDAVSAAWGQAPGTILTNGTDIYIPGLLAGNVFIGLQPARGGDGAEAARYHDKSLPPHHQYVAFYRWLEHEFGADAVIHVGTHGTVEFLPGNENAVSDACWPDNLLSAMPHFYYYYVGNPAEATIAKRRSHACLLSYAPPAWDRSGLYGEYAELDSLINAYTEAEGLAPHQLESRREEILAKAAAVDLTVDDPEDVDSIAAELTRRKTMLMPKGLHAVGSRPDEQERVLALAAVLSWDREEAPALATILSATGTAATENALTDTDVARGGSRGGVAGAASADELHERSLVVIRSRFFGDRTEYRRVKAALSPQRQDALDSALEFGESVLRNMESSDELGSLIRALDGRYVPARVGGDLLRDPEILPTGHNIYQFDARKVPAPQAIRRGGEIADSTIEHYRKTHGVYPQSVSVVLWGLETSRTKGETVGQILRYLGVRLLSRPMSQTKQLAVVPLEELGRPRIDCVVTICGFFRDMFPVTISLLDEAFELVADQDEPEESNFIRTHVTATESALAERCPAGEARELARGRIFGPKEGEYGTGITILVENRSWEEELDIVDSYLGAQQHLYTRTRRGDAQEALFKGALGTVDVVSQVRSSVEYTIGDLDHYYEFFGGLARSVEAVRGHAPRMLFTDSSGSAIYTDDAAKATEISVRTRLLNPSYIDALLETPVHGAQHIAKRVENLIGLSATTHTVGSDVYADVKATFIDDTRRYDQLRANNEYALAEVLRRLIEANRRGYWDADEEEIRELTERYLELEGRFEEAEDAPKESTL